MNDIELFSDYIKLVGFPTMPVEEGVEKKLNGKTLGIVNAANWISLWSVYFGKKILPGVRLINICDDSVQWHFTEAFKNNKPCPPQKNLDAFAQHSEALCERAGVDAIILTCSTMNRAYKTVQAHVEKFNVPIIQIDEPMMEMAVENGGKVLVVATLDTTVKSTIALLEETAKKNNKSIEIEGAEVNDAFALLGSGKIQEHNEVIAKAIRNAQKKDKIDIVVLAQLSMAVFSLSYPDPVKEFGIEVLNSAETGFQRVAEVLQR